MTWQLDFSIGPVQSFVGESRRTRDLWGSSYLLSFLAAHAMVAAEQAGGTLLAVADDPMYRAVRDGAGADPPRIGTVPNHFQATVAGDPRAVAAAAEDGLRRAWRRVCEAVWDRYVAPVALDGDGTAAIWQRQVDSFWQVVWVAGPGDDVRGLLHRRKHWHSHRPPDEPGDKCTVMPQFQELSGHVRTHGGRARDGQREFWRRLRIQTRGLDLREDERLCAIALVKRLFPDSAETALRWPVDTGNWPSTVWVGALPWLHTVHDAAPEAADRYAQAVRRHSPAADRTLSERIGSLAPAGELPRLDANYLHRGFVANPRLCPLPRADQEPAARAELGRLLGGLSRTINGDPSPPAGPPVYYALLRADGDRLGELAACQGREQVGQALADFAGRDLADGVETIVHQHGGVTIYAGGDDVLAMLPVPGALGCAAALSDRYRDVFARHDMPSAHLSAAVLFAHVRLPLGAALAESQRLLEDVAKERSGRDSLAAAVLKQGSRHCEWFTKWRRHGLDGQPACAVAMLDQLTSRLRPDRTDPGFSSSLLYQIREALSLLTGWPRWEPGRPGELPVGVDAEAYLRAEIRQSLAGSGRPGDRDGGDPEAVLRATTEELVSLVWPLLRQPDESAGATAVSLDPLLLARFLAHGGHEEEHG